MTSVGATVNDVRLTTSPSPTDNVPDIQSISFLASNLSLELQSFYPQTGSPSFKINPATPQDMNMIVKAKIGRDTALPVTLDFDQQLLSLSTMEEIEDAFLGSREFFDDHACRFPSHEKLIFGSSRIPRTPQGYLAMSFVRQIRIGNESIPGNVLTRPGFGTIRFGLILGDSLNRRATMALIKMGSDPAGDVDLSGTETNGIWQ